MVQSKGVDRNLLLYMVTCNIFKTRPKNSDENFWPFEFVDDEPITQTQEEQNKYTPDYFTERALGFVQSTTVRETLGLTFKDVMNMDYGMLLWLEKITDKLDDSRKKQLDNLDNGMKLNEPDK